MPVHTCRRKHNDATTAVKKQNGMKGQKGREKKRGMKNARREPDGTKGKYNTRENKKEKPNIHKQQQTHRRPKRKCGYVTCRATLRYENEKSTTITTPTKVTKRCSRGNVPTPAHPLT